ncbi:DUF3413 domain-containing protein [Thalassotalea aquiviva]|uniref:DUF3413 domain-containing protein n=1 Tax=Thalassotalea aquiviva TaxID=3242415 RepID=UPI00352B8287
MVNKDNTTYSKRLLQLISWGHWFTFFNIFAAIIIAIIFLNAEGIPDDLIGKFYMFTNWFSHMAFLTFILFVLTVFPLTLIYPKTRFIRGAASLIFTLLLTLLMLDGFTYYHLGYHLNWASSSQIFSLLYEKMQVNKLAFAGHIVLTLLTLLVFELVASNYAWKHLRSLQQLLWPKIFVGVLVSSFFISHLIHVWADANLQYSVLRQDRVLPFSYPSTAKTLLTKYGLFDQQDYAQRRNLSIKLEQKAPQYPDNGAQCAITNNVQGSVFIVLNDDTLTEKQVKQFKLSSSIPASQLYNHMDSALDHDAWFNLLFSLPSIYQQDILAQNKKPMLFQAMSQQDLTTSLTVFSENKTMGIESGLSSLFENSEQFNDIDKFLSASALNGFKQGVHIFYFSDMSEYKYDLFVNALLLAQKSKQQKDIIWLGSLGNKSFEQSFSPKPSLLIWPNKKAREITRLSSPMDIQPTLMRYWLQCRTSYKEYSNGKNLYRLKNDRVIGNTSNDGLMIFKKDKTIFIDRQGNFESYSTQLNTLISESYNFPMMIDGINSLNQFSVYHQQKQAVK